MGKITYSHCPDMGNPEVQAVIDELIDAVKTLDRQAVLALSPVSQTAGPLYTANEQQMLNDLKNQSNGMKTGIGG